MSRVELSGVAGRVLTDCTLTLETGLCVVVGSVDDGAAEVVEIAAGIAPARSGTVRIDGSDPYRDPGVRRRVGAMLETESLPAGRNVERAVDHALRARGDGRAAHTVLEAWGLESLGRRPPRDLSGPETRAVAFAVALENPSPACLVLSDPLCRLAGVPRDRVADRLTDVASTVPVLCAVTRVSDAFALGGRVSLLERGRIARHPGVPLGTELVPGTSLELVVVTEEARRVAAAVSAEAAVLGVSWTEAAPGEVVVRSASVEDAALAAQRVAAQLGVLVRAIRMRAPSLELVQSASSALLRASYDNAYRVAQAHAGRAPQGSEGGGPQ